MSLTASNWPRDPQPTQLLHYLPSFQVVVCTSCRYAIQPNAISRHLKEIHHIYRSRRRPFIEYVSSLPLKEPQDVILPKAHEFPVPYLPVEQGFMCESKGCPYLCVSVKRMKSHWVSEHGRKGQTEVDWHSVPLQTFFRGNFLQYFTQRTHHNQTGSDIKEDGGRRDRFARDLFAAEPRGCDDYDHVAISPVGKETQGQVLDAVDSAILQHYFTSTYMSFATSDETESIWRVTVPELAYRNRFLMHGILACSAQHLAYLNPTQQQEYTVRACSHQDEAVPLFRFAIEHADKDNCDAILAFSYLLVIYSLAAEQREESLFLVDSAEPDILPSWLHFLRGGCSMLCSVWDFVESGPVQLLALAWDIPFDIAEACKTPFLVSLLSVIPNPTSENAWSDEVCAVYHDAAVELGRSFVYMQALGESPTTWDILRIWPMRVSVAYMALLRDRHSGALVLLAHYCVLLKKMQSHWYFEGRAARLMSAILLYLDARWYCYIQGPLEEVYNCG
ncbi:hypothetical protein V1523DRAFT_398221 [Lipomyces doorenjongii]